ncbi:SMI1/KNR4 family protein [Fontibacillus panacisegetis]|uniref:SMI1/KNR4 family protein n=1 Tax=Fontibacillus solani TaxID=1572857 RepID=UPI0015F8F578|nr:SMI1/KNR4 family protein [Fontibacillus solani]
MSFEIIRERIDRIASRIIDIGGEVQEIVIQDPATENQIELVEHHLGIALPNSFKHVLLNFSSDFSFRWFLPDNLELLNKFRGIFSGRPNWNLHQIIEIDEGRRGWVEHVFPNPEDEYDKVWHNKLAFMEVGNGDYFAFDLSEQGEYPIVYLSHDDGEGHGFIIANNFIDFINNWSRIGFVGTEDWQWMPFVESKQSGINPDGASAIEFRELMNFNI